MNAIIGFLRNVKKLQTYLLEDKLLILKAFFITGIMRIVLIVIPFKNLKKYLGKCNEESGNNIINSYKIKKISWAITKISNYTPWESKCFVQALTAQRLLHSENFESTLYLGVSKNVIKKMTIAHAWVRCGDIYVTGGDGHGFTIIAKFKK